jgi:hypothetical protein
MSRSLDVAFSSADLTRPRLLVPDLQEDHMARSSQYINLLVLSVFLAVPSVRCAMSDEIQNAPVSEAVRETAESFINNARRVRIDKYGNVHFVVIESVETRPADKKVTKLITEVTFWSREDRYFRVDSRVLESVNRKERQGSRRRLIVRPEGYVAMFSDAAEKPLAIGKWGNADEGLMLMFAHGNFIQRAARVGRLPSDVLIEELISEDSYLPELYKRPIPANAVETEQSATLTSPWTSHTSETLTQATTNDDGHLEVEWTSELLVEPHWISNSSLVCDPKNGVTLTYESDLTTANKRTMLVEASLEYDIDRYGCIPALEVEKTTNSAGTPDDHVSTVERRIQEVDWSPVPMGIFSLEAQGFVPPNQTSIWLRRFLTIVVGLVLIGFYVVMRQLRRRNVA